MLTIFTQAAIAVLHDISFGNHDSSAIFPLTPEDLEKLLNGLEAHRLILHLPGKPANTPSSYGLCRPLHQITLLEVLEATGEPIHIDYPLPESNYFYHGEAAKKLGIVSHMSRLFLANIKLTDW